MLPHLLSMHYLSGMNPRAICEGAVSGNVNVKCSMLNEHAPRYSLEVWRARWDGGVGGGLRCNECDTEQCVRGSSSV